MNLSEFIYNKLTARLEEQLENNDLNIVYSEAISLFKSEKVISEVFGIGSYFFPHGEKKPNDVDFVIKLNISFENEEVFNLSDNLEKLKDNHLGNGSTLLNVFIVDSKNRKLNSVDLYYIKYKGEDLEENIRTRKNQIYWKDIQKIL